MRGLAARGRYHLANMSILQTHRLLSGITVALLSLFAVSFFWERPALLTAILAALGLTMWLIKPERAELLLYVICGILGASYEIIAIAFGAWSFAMPNTQGIPYWLPLLWGLAALFMKRIYDKIAESRL